MRRQPSSRSAAPPGHSEGASAKSPLRSSPNDSSLSGLAARSRAGRAAAARSPRRSLRPCARRGSIHAASSSSSPIAWASSRRRREARRAAALVATGVLDSPADFANGPPQACCAPVAAMGKRKRPGRARGVSTPTGSALPSLMLAARSQALATQAARNPPDWCCHRRQ